MIKATVLFLACFGLLYWMNDRLGYWEAYQIGYGLVVALALSISVTFFWLYFLRATPLSLGMAIGWAGAFGVMGFWWLFNELAQPEGMRQHPILFAFIALYLVGGILHFDVLLRSLAVQRWVLAVPVVLMLGLSLF